jgi:hypothetical protein
VGKGSIQPLAKETADWTLRYPNAMAEMGPHVSAPKEAGPTLNTTVYFDKIKDIIVKAKLEINADSKPTAKQG